MATSTRPPASRRAEAGGEREEGLEQALLGLLRRRPMHAYEMYQQLLEVEALGRIWRLKQSHLYALLARLEAAGYLESTTEPQGTRPPRRVLHLTPEGEASFERWVTTPVAHGRDFRLAFLAKLYFAAEHGPATAARLIAGQRGACDEWIASLRAHIAAVEPLGTGEAPAPRQTFDRLVLQFRLSQLTAIADWLGTCAAALA